MKSKYTYNGGRKSETISLKECIDNLLDAYKLRGKYNETHIINSWERIMGKAIASRTTKLLIRGEKMYVELNSAPLKQELNLSKSKIIKLLNDDLGVEVIKEINFI
ncbi:MAG TPA: DUF721 domain-containing protein [Cytophagaceae bacterium]